MAVDRFSFAREKLQQLNVDGYASLIELFDQACEQYAERVAYSCLGQEMRFAEICEKSGQIAAYLRGELGLQAGDRVAV